MNKVSIIIPHYNNYSIINQCLKSLLKINYKNIEIIIIDNNSSVDSFLKIKNNYNNIILNRLNDKPDLFIENKLIETLSSIIKNNKTINLSLLSEMLNIPTKNYNEKVSQTINGI